jgi:Ca2+-binding RTX toxin-like protein
MRRNQLRPTRRFERLEDRRMMAADIDLDNGILNVQGTDGNNFISIAAHPSDSDKLRVIVTDYSGGGLLAQEDVDREDVEEIVVNGLNGGDQIANFTNIRARLNGGGGNDWIQGGDGIDIIDGGAGDDSLIGGRGNDELIGGTGNDRYEFYGTQLGSDVVHEAASIDADSLDFRQLGGAANVNLASTVAQVVNSNLTLRLTSATGIENVDGSSFNDIIRGNSRNNVLMGNTGNDSLFGDAGDDDLFGGGGMDSLYGGIGNDDLFGEAGNDWLYGEAGLDNLDGGADNDFLDGGRDGYVDRLTGGSGQDTFVKYKKRSLSFYDFEQKVLDYNSAVDVVLTRYY